MAVAQGMNGHRLQKKEALRVLIAGAGIGGLTAAIALRRQGHDVEVFESSRFASELGAAIHVAPNAHGLLKRLGVEVEATGANECLGFTSWSSSGELLKSQKFGEQRFMWQHSWVLAHRVKLHSALRDTAVSDNGAGNPVKLHLATPVSSVDSKNATIHFKDGTTATGDVVIGADGVHSVTRQSLAGKDGSKKAFGSGASAFRFLIPRGKLMEAPETRHFFQDEGVLHICYGRDRRIVAYPTTNNTFINFVAIHPEAETAATATGEWDTGASKELLLDVYEDFSDDWKQVLSKADNESLKIWKLLDMEKLDNWSNERVAVIGDAAHPFLPHQGQGGGQAIEDAVALAVVLEPGLQPQDVPGRLKLYQDIRKERADKIQHFTRLAGEGHANPQEAARVMWEFTQYNFGHDEHDNATQRLREWQWAQKPETYWRMPKAFGPMPGPRQSHNGEPREAEGSTYTTASIKIKTSRTVLQNLFPPGSKQWRFKSPGTTAFCSFSQTTLDKMEWLGGKGYNHIGLYIHGVEYVKEDGSTIDGTYLPILVEDLTDPIISGREELGMPKVFSAIDIEKDTNSYHIRTSWRGYTWGRFELDELREESQTNGATDHSPPAAADAGILSHRYVPAVGKEKKGTADAEYAVFDAFSEANPKPKQTRRYVSNKARVTLNARDWTTLPTLHHIIERLAEIPIYEVVSAQVVEGTGVSDVSGARRIE